MPTLPLRAPALLLVLAACQGDRADAPLAARFDTLPGGVVRVMTASPVDSGRWSLVLERTVQPEDETPGELRDPNDIVLLEDGSLLVADDKPRSVMRFDPSGQFVGTIGREGAGPGEFRSAWLAVRGDTLAVQDPTAGRAVTFSLASGVPLMHRQTVPRFYSRIEIDGAGRVIAPMMMPPDSTRGPFQAYLRFSLDGATLDTAMLPERPKADRRWIVREGNNIRFEMQVPLQPRDRHAADPMGGFVTGWSGEYLLRFTRNGSDTLRLFGRPMPSGTVTADEKARIVEQRIAENKEYTPEAVLRASLLASAIPDQRPAYEQLVVDPRGRTWVRLASGDTTQVRFDLFDREGRWLDQLAVQQSGWNREWWQPVSFASDRVAVLLEGEDGRPAILIYRIQRRN
ncbi:MAG: hypothetical protein SFU84_12775 [Gemmatimonadales bacterium]|nr:hypothetical protein [Gemmatimonadales bacterium]